MSKMIIPYGRQTILDEDIDAVVNVLKSDYLTLSRNQIVILDICVNASK